MAFSIWLHLGYETNRGSEERDLLPTDTGEEDVEGLLGKNLTTVLVLPKRVMTSTCSCADNIEPLLYTFV